MNIIHSTQNTISGSTRVYGVENTRNTEDYSIEYNLFYPQ